MGTVIDIHAHYVPPELISVTRNRGAQLGVRLVEDAATPALHFDYGFKVRPFFPKLIEPVAERTAWLDEKNIDYQLVATWPDIYGYGLPPERCVAWHRALNDTLAAWCGANAARFGFIASVPLPKADDAAAELVRAADIGVSVGPTGRHDSGAAAASRAAMTSTRASTIRGSNWVPLPAVMWSTASFDVQACL